MRLNGNINLSASGHTEGSVAGNAWLPFVEVHMESGVFHNVSGPAQSGVIRFDPYNNGMEFSNDGGLTFTSFGTAGVTSLGVIGGANLTGANLEGANLYKCNLKGANLYKCNLAKCNVYKSKLASANNLIDALY